MAQNASDSRVNRLLMTLCVGLVAYVVSGMLLGVVSIPRYYARVTTGTVPTVRVGSVLVMSNDLVAQSAATRGLSLESYAVYSILLNVVTTLGFATVAALILWKGRRHWFHWFTAFVLLFAGAAGWNFATVAQIASAYLSLGVLLWPAFFLFLYLFPNGRAVPSRSRWVMGPLAAFHLAAQVTYLAPGIFPLVGALWLVPVEVVAFPVILLAQLYRYFRGSTHVERAQIKWFVAGLALFFVVGLITSFVAESMLADRGFVDDMSQLLTLFIPTSIGIAILRYRLYDIDVIIRRTLVYGTLTAILAVVYIGSVVVLQTLLRPLVGLESELAIVASTLAIYVLFQPLRRRIQQTIDRRFYRRTYDARQVLESFSARLRNETDLDTLTQDMVSVVQKTLQPEHVSLWLKDSRRAEEGRG